MARRVLLAAVLVVGGACTLDRSGLVGMPPDVDGGAGDAGTTGDAGHGEDGGRDATTGSDSGDATIGSDGGIACAPWDWSPSDVDPCALDVVGDGIVVTGRATFDTDSGVLVDAVGAEHMPPSVLLAGSDTAPARRVISVAGLVIESGAVLRILGEAALVVLVHGDATIAGSIDVSASVEADGSSSPGPGAAPFGACTAGRASDGQDATDPDGGGGGGGGGAFGRDGGDGGDGDGDGHGARGAKGAANGNDLLVPLRGGCAGGDGGSGISAGTSGSGGAPAGAVQLVVRDVLIVRGTLRSAGAGGRGGNDPRGGGGGGGSGGGIFLEAGELAIEAPGRLCANGGSGGEGASGSSNGADGELGNCDERSGARTTDSGHGGGDGGDGGYVGSNSGNGEYGSPGSSGGGGGGGGGGTGRIHLRGVRSASVDPSSTISPEPRISS